MQTQEILATDNEQFSSFLDNEILVIREKQHIFYLTKDVRDMLLFV